MSLEPESRSEDANAKELVIIDQPDALRVLLAHAKHEGSRIGVVPTMGALHAGHLSLMQTAREECDVVVATIFVNPLQFGPHEDFERYPRPMEHDVQCCKQFGVDVIFHPANETLYPQGFDSFVEVGQLSKKWEGEHREGHFRGVTTVVMKLLNIVAADIAYFGLKDYQQLAIIRRMCADLNVSTEIQACPIIRDGDGLALSSRNQYLSAEERQSALVLSQSLRMAHERLINGEQDLPSIRQAMHSLLESTEHVVPDYAIIADPDTLEELTKPQNRMVALVAARVGKTRLIDNMPIELSSE